MKIINTFVPGLTTFKIVEQDELARNLELFLDPQYLYVYFEKYFDKFSYFGIKSIKEAVEFTLIEANLLQDKLIELVDSNKELDSFFKNLDNYEYRITSLSKQKSSHRWLRLYAIKIESNQYVITGGAIKLTPQMKDSEETQKELFKLEECRNFLKENGIDDLSTLNSFILEL